MSDYMLLVFLMQVFLIWMEFNEDSYFSSFYSVMKIKAIMLGFIFYGLT
jgi:hypothetical protein